MHTFSYNLGMCGIQKLQIFHLRALICKFYSCNKFPLIKIICMTNIHLAVLNVIYTIHMLYKAAITVDDERKEAVKANTLLPMLAQLKDSSYDIQFQSLRAIGNLCYEYGMCILWCLCVCLCVCVCLCLYLCVCVCVLCVCLSVCLSVYLSVYV